MVGDVTSKPASEQEPRAAKDSGKIQDRGDASRLEWACVIVRNQHIRRAVIRKH